MTNDILIDVKGLRKVFTVGTQQIEVLKGVDAEINRGDFAIIFGPSGCGKSTLLHSILGMEPPTAGKVVVDGKELYSMSEDEIVKFRKERIGVVFQQTIWIKSLNVLENVSFPNRLRGMMREEAEKKAMACLQVVKLDDWAHHHPSELSSGQQQRVSVARALTIDPIVIVADEPTGNLDTVAGDELMEFLAGLNKEQHKTIVMVTHDLEYLRYANRLIHIIDGEKVEEMNGNSKSAGMAGSLRNKKGIRNGVTTSDADFLKKNGQNHIHQKIKNEN